MVKVYSIALVVGIVGLLVVILGGTFAENIGREDKDPGERLGTAGKMAIGALVGFGMGGMSAEFSPLDLSWPTALAIAIVASALAAYWVRYAVRQYEA